MNVRLQTILVAAGLGLAGGALADNAESAPGDLKGLLQQSTWEVMIRAVDDANTKLESITNAEINASVKFVSSSDHWSGGKDNVYVVTENSAVGNPVRSLRDATTETKRKGLGIDETFWGNEDDENVLDKLESTNEEAGEDFEWRITVDNDDGWANWGFAQTERQTHEEAERKVLDDVEELLAESKKGQSALKTQRGRVDAWLGEVAGRLSATSRFEEANAWNSAGALAASVITKYYSDYDKHKCPGTEEPADKRVKVHGDKYAYATLHGLWAPVTGSAGAADPGAGDGAGGNTGPGGQGSTTAGGNTGPGGQGATTAGGNTGPGAALPGSTGGVSTNVLGQGAGTGQGSTTAGGNTGPGGQGSTTAGGNTGPGGQGSTTAGGNTGPGGQGSTTAGGNTGPGGQGSTTAGGNTGPGGQGSTTAGGNTGPGGQGSTTAGGNTGPGGQGSTTAGGNTGPGGQGSTTAGGNTGPGGQGSTTAGGNTGPGGQGSTTAGGNTGPGGQGSTTAGGSSGPSNWENRARAWGIAQTLIGIQNSAQRNNWDVGNSGATVAGVMAALGPAVILTGHNNGNTGGVQPTTINTAGGSNNPATPQQMLGVYGGHARTMRQRLQGYRQGNLAQQVNFYNSVGGNNVDGWRMQHLREIGADIEFLGAVSEKVPADKLPHARAQMASLRRNFAAYQAATAKFLDGTITQQEAAEARNAIDKMLQDMRAMDLLSQGLAT